MNFRAIRPAGSLADAAGLGRNSGLQPPLKRQAVAKACHDCRRAKIKCGGQRPKCSTCVVKNRACGYAEFGPRTRLETLEKLMGVLCNGTQDEADNLLQRLRTVDDVRQAAEEIAGSTEDETPAILGSRKDSYQSSSSISSSGSQNHGLSHKSTTLSNNGSRSSFTSRSTSSSDTQQMSLTSLPNRSDPDMDSKVTESSQKDSDVNLDAKTASNSVTTTAMMTPTSELIRITLPDASVTSKAVESFYSCAGKLFHVFNRDQISEIYRVVYEASSLATGSIRADVAALMSVAAVGAQYMLDEFGIKTSVGFYDLARHCFEAVVEHQPPRAIRVCALLAQYNILDKSVVSLAYVEIGLGMSRLYGVGNKKFPANSIPSAEWIDSRKTWRTLMFFSSWLSSSLGYISGNDVLSERLSLVDYIVNDPADIAEIVQTEMVKICLLKADILRMQWRFNDATLRETQAIMRDLRLWYGDLPEVMRLEASGHEDLEIETKRSILHIHLLYLGAMMLLYRRFAARFLQSYLSGNSSEIFKGSLQGIVLELSSEVALAASTSARIVKLLLEDNSIFKRCWLVIYQTYTTCTVLLHVASQKQLHGFEPSTWENEKAYARGCLAVLSYCGSSDRVAGRYHEQLSHFFKNIFSEGVQPHDNSTSSTEMEGVIAGAHGSPGAAVCDNEHLSSAHHWYLLHIPPEADATRVQLSLSLLFLLSKPFGDPSAKGLADDSITKYWTGEPTRYEYPQMSGQLNWDPESRDPFEWDLQKLNASFLNGTKFFKNAAEVPGMHASSPMNHSHGFLDSTEPNGWTSASDMMKTSSGKAL